MIILNYVGKMEEVLTLSSNFISTFLLGGYTPESEISFFIIENVYLPALWEMKEKENTYLSLFKNLVDTASKDQFCLKGDFTQQLRKNDVRRKEGRPGYTAPQLWK